MNHLWQSTAVTAIAALLAFALRANHARARFWLWAIASVKFLVPFSLLIAAGEALRPAMTAPIEKPELAAVMEQITQPYQQVVSTAAVSSASDISVVTQHSSNWWPAALVAVWLCGAAVLAFLWLHQWLQMRRMVGAATRLTMCAEVPVLSTPSLFEPGVFGIIRPVLLLPEGIMDRLSAEQLSTILAHEMTHVRRRDNLMAALHMVVETLFWFHPAVWWIKAHLLEERERACDEAVLQSGNQADLYAESILNVCKFYVESPMICVSGVTGSDLKKRIVRIMTGQVSHQLDLSRKLMLAAAATVAVAVPVVFGLVHIDHAFAQTAVAKIETVAKLDVVAPVIRPVLQAATPKAEADPQNLAGTWQGTLHAGKDLRVVLKVTKDDKGAYKSVFYSIDQGGQSLPVANTTLQSGTVKLDLSALGGAYEGKMSPDGKSIDGKWMQGPNPLALALERATAETEWAIPEPPKKMAADANPSFEVATIKPTKPGDQRTYITVRGNSLVSENFSLTDYISFAYGVQKKQVTGLPAWAEEAKFDITAKPDIDGIPNDKQLKGMVQKLLAERFQLAFHHDKKELSVYVLSVGKAGNKMTKSERDPNGLPGLFFPGKLGDLRVTNATMADFTGLMQSAVLDRPVLDQTGIAGRWDFKLTWTPDDSQFAGFGAKIPPPTDSATAPPNLYTAIQEQIGLKLEATKANADVLVIDKVEKPSDN
jgi:uncharacterized protein (TIGR03435 family)